MKATRHVKAASLEETLSENREGTDEAQTGRGSNALWALHSGLQGRGAPWRRGRDGQAHLSPTGRHSQLQGEPGQDRQVPDPTPPVLLALRVPSLSR